MTSDLVPDAFPRDLTPESGEESWTAATSRSNGPIGKRPVTTSTMSPGSSTESCPFPPVSETSGLAPSPPVRVSRARKASRCRGPRGQLPPGRAGNEALPRSRLRCRRRGGAGMRSAAAECGALRDGRARHGRAAPSRSTQDLRRARCKCGYPGTLPARHRR
jgi:hypothetical protein